MFSDENTFKVVLIGDADVGKTKIALRYMEGKFTKETQSTIGVEFSVKQLTIRNTKIKLQIWDTAGTERYRSVTKTFMQKAKGALVVFDLTKRASFDSIDQWVEEVKKIACPSVKLLLIGNKSDLTELRKVSVEECKEKADRLGARLIRNVVCGNKRAQWKQCGTGV